MGKGLIPGVSWEKRGRAAQGAQRAVARVAQARRSVCRGHDRESAPRHVGAGAAPMERYFLRLTETQHNSGQEAGSYFAFHLMYDDAFVAAAQKERENRELFLFSKNTTTMRMELLIRCDLQ